MAVSEALIVWCGAKMVRAFIMASELSLWGWRRSSPGAEGVGLAKVLVGLRLPGEGNVGTLGVWSVSWMLEAMCCCRLCFCWAPVMSLTRGMSWVCEAVPSDSCLGIEGLSQVVAVPW